MDEKEMLVEFYYFRFQAVRRAHKRYLLLLLSFLTFIWTFWSRPRGLSSAFLGIPVSDIMLLGVTPWISTVLVLGLVGSFRAIEPAFQRLKEVWGMAGASTELNSEMINAHGSWIDYLAFIWAGPFSRWIYSAVLIASFISNVAIGLILAPKLKGYEVFLFTSSCLLCLAVHVAACWKLIAQRPMLAHLKDQIGSLSPVPTVDNEIRNRT